MSPSSQSVVCVLGMHRSGTSLVARFLHLLGVHLGPEALLSRAGRDNPTGYWEHPDFVDINNTILSRLGGRWEEPPAQPDGWASDARLDDLRDRARALVASLSAHPVWGWKDPRTCLTLPFWQQVIGPMRYVLCIRNPLAVAGSLARRNATSVERADWLWLAHTRASLAATEGHARTIVFYEDLLVRWQEDLPRLAVFAGTSARGDEPHIREAAGAFLQTELCHHRQTLQDLIGDRRISLATKLLYVALHDADFAATGAVETAVPERDILFRENREQATTISALKSERDSLALEAATRTRERDDLRRTIDQIHTSRAFRFATFLGRLRRLDRRPPA